MWQTGTERLIRIQPSWVVTAATYASLGASVLLTANCERAPVTIQQAQEAPLTPKSQAEPVDYARDILPIFSQNCLSCHGPSPTAGTQFRLDQPETLTLPGPDGRAAVVQPGDAAHSPLFLRISAKDASIMPPQAYAAALAESEIELIGHWIDQGAQGSEHWSHQVLTRPELPAVGHQAWQKNAIDAFVAQRLEGAGLEPMPQADPGQLIRRVALDLTGLPPTPEDVVAFVADPSEQNYQDYVERLLQSPAYGEHRAHYWLDAVRYADTHGYHYDDYRSIWPYRDYVISAFNDNMPFDQFAREQLAGDLIPGAGESQKVATGFVRCAMSTNEGGVVEEEFATLYARDRVETFGAVFLGLTLQCAACHDHKYDPVTQRDFYSLAAFFSNSSQPVLDGNTEDTPPNLLLADGATTLVTDELPNVPTAQVLSGGRYDAPIEQVSAAAPVFLPPLPAGMPANRLALADWLFLPSNPLTLRTVVNRFWSEVFGAGIVRTPGDLGLAGDLPSHPELLDWLAMEFRSTGYDVKALFRLIVTSATYRQSPVLSAAAHNADPDNRLLSRGPRFRMDAEMVRDLALASSGLLVRQVGGPSVKPYQPPAIWSVVAVLGSNTGDYVPDEGEGLYRRTVYTFWKRQAPPPGLQVLDAPTREHPMVQRERTNTPLQALITLNDVQYVEAARKLAEAVLLEQSDRAARLDAIGLRVLARRFTDKEHSLLSSGLDSQLSYFESSPEQASELLGYGASSVDTQLSATELAGWTLTANTILNLDEALNK